MVVAGLMLDSPDIVVRTRSHYRARTVDFLILHRFEITCAI